METETDYFNVFASTESPVTVGSVSCYWRLDWLKPIIYTTSCWVLIFFSLCAFDDKACKGGKVAEHDDSHITQDTTLLLKWYLYITYNNDG